MAESAVAASNAVELSEEQDEFLKSLEEEFKDRFTENDDEYKVALETETPPPPILLDWDKINRGGNYGGRNRRFGRYNGGREWRHDGGGDRYGRYDGGDDRYGRYDGGDDRYGRYDWGDDRYGRHGDDDRYRRNDDWDDRGRYGGRRPRRGYHRPY